MSDIKASPLRRAIAIVGSQQKLADAIGGLRSQSAISRMLLGEAPLSPAVAKAIEQATDFEVRRWELLPEVWDPPEAGVQQIAKSESAGA